VSLFRRTLNGFALLAYVLAATLPLSHAHWPLASAGAAELASGQDQHAPADGDACQICAALHVAGKGLLPEASARLPAPSIVSLRLPRLASAALPSRSFGFRPRAPPLA
jgi:hypothetical protein